ncbi:MAG: phosphatase PAP2 family protein [Pseudomonadota bacterium]
MTLVPAAEGTLAPDSTRTVAAATANDPSAGARRLPLQTGVANLLRHIARYVMNDAATYGAVLLYVAAAFIYLSLAGSFNIDALVPRYVTLFTNYSLIVFIPLFLIGTLAGDVFRCFTQSDRPAPSLASSDYWARLSVGLVLIALFIPMMASYSTVKTVLPFSAGFPYEESLAQIDAFLHGGDPWIVTHWLLDPDVFGRWLDRNYHQTWLVYWTGFAFWVCVCRRADQVRTRYIISMMLTWGLLGNVIAALTMSAGPVFYAGATGDAQRFADLNAFIDQLNAGDSLVKYLSTYLWQNYEARAVGPGSGISAVPSLHVAIVTLNAFFVRELFGKWWGALAWLFVAVISFSSVYLGWHYAIDAYISIILVAMIYWVGLRLDRATRGAANAPS